MPSRDPAAPAPVAPPVEPWVRIELTVPAPWKRWLEQAAEARALSVAALVRQCIRELMLRRHDAPGGAT